MFRSAVLATVSVAAAFFVSAATGSVRADFNDEVRRCDSGGDHPDIQIISCTRNIRSGRFTGRNLAVAFTNRAFAYKRKGLWDKAITDYDEAIRLAPDLVFAFNNRGNAYYFKGQLDRAVENYDTAIRLQPDLAEAFANRANVYRKKGQLDRAFKDYEKAIELEPSNARVFADRGLCFEKNGEATKALLDFKKAHALGFRHSLLLKKLRLSGEIL